MNRIITVITLLLSAFIAAAFLQDTKGLVTVYDTGSLLPMLSDYNIFTGDPLALTPGNGFHLYELATGLFTDYAEKQRLIKVPAGQTITAVNDGLPQFPDGTILVKTFYYLNDKRDGSKGWRLIETRLLVKHNGQWTGGAYVWNKAQTDAVLVTGALKTGINWIDENANPRQISYQIPSAKDCGACHNTNNAIMPIGMKIRNMNRDVVRNNTSINQLQYLQDTGIMDTVNPARFSQFPTWQSNAWTITERVRAYLDVNCAHCHSETGSCARAALRFAWEIPLENTRITASENRIVRLMSTGKMPRTGTTIIDTEALALIKKYLQQ